MLKAELQAILDLCVEALEAAELVQDQNSALLICPWCEVKRYPGRQIANGWRHAADCLGQRALAAAREE